jgi:hypothetical protein
MGWRSLWPTAMTLSSGDSSVCKLASQAVTFGLESPFLPRMLRWSCDLLAFVLLCCPFLKLVLRRLYIWGGRFTNGGQSGRTANRRSRGPRPWRGRKASTQAPLARPTATQTAQRTQVDGQQDPRGWALYKRGASGRLVALLFCFVSSLTSRACVSHTALAGTLLRGHCYGDIATATAETIV